MKTPWPWWVWALLALALWLLGPWLAQGVVAFGSVLSKPFFWWSQPLGDLRGVVGPVGGALLLGLLGALAPCQITTNAAALVYVARLPRPWIALLWFVLGKGLVYVVLGWVVTEGLGGLAPGWFFAGVRQALGPLMLLMGVVLLGWLRLPLPAWGAGGLGDWAKHRQDWIGALTLGMAFGLAFCPTLFGLYFGLLLPSAAVSPLGVVFPALFALGTVFPLALLLTALPTNGPKGPTLHRWRQIGGWLQQVGGWLLLAVGLHDTLLYNFA